MSSPAGLPLLDVGRVSDFLPLLFAVVCRLINNQVSMNVLFSDCLLFVRFFRIFFPSPHSHRILRLGIPSRESQPPYPFVCFGFALVLSLLSSPPLVAFFFKYFPGGRFIHVPGFGGSPSRCVPFTSPQCISIHPTGRGSRRAFSAFPFLVGPPSTFSFKEENYGWGGVHRVRRGL